MKIIVVKRGILLGYSQLWKIQYDEDIVDKRSKIRLSKTS